MDYALVLALGLFAGTLGGIVGTGSSIVLMCSIGMYLAKVATFEAFGALPLEVLLRGLGIGLTLMAGSFVGRLVVLRVAQGTYQGLVDGLMLVSGVSLLWAAVR